ncbi:elongation factor 1-beta-like [Quercus robur]|uniref:elongation factor 1-beta-like n=1 Tax=Quercus robur TaxID=38942 RepID=UPI00216272F9|nr:elongation factor 1-beta-like [Quercus robur]
MFYNSFVALPLQIPCVVFLKKGVVSLLRELPPSKRRRLQPLLLVTQRPLLLRMMMMMMMMWTFSVKRLKRRRRLLRNVLLLSRHLAKRRTGNSSVLLDVKPWDDETDMKKLEEAVRIVQMEGLLWGASKLVPVGYGIKKMTIMLTIVDDLVSVDTLIEEHLTVEPINEYDQSCDIVAFNKI